MHFSLTESQRDLAALAQRVFSEQSGADRVSLVEASGSGLDVELWATLGRTGLLAAALPEDVGGSGLGMLELGLLLEAQGRSVAPVPVLASLVLGAGPVSAFGSTEQRRRLLGPVAAGTGILSGGLVDAAGGTVRLTGSDDRADSAAGGGGHGTRQLSGQVGFVPFADLADRVVVPLSDGFAYVDPKAAGVSLRRLESVAGSPLWLLGLDGVGVDPADLVTAPGVDPAAWLTVRALVAAAALQCGVSDGAVKMTASYTAGREQFGRALASFQAVQQRLADAYIDVECLRVTWQQAAWRLDAGLEAEAEARMAKFWAAEAGQRVAAAAQHLHGGMGVDLAYPLHRYWRHAKELELWLGGAGRHLEWIGRRLAAGDLAAVPV